ncbi:MAG TPA: PIG-L family deacetylase [Candidatus Solibacter sp.]|nr:PIG-L family deacetylase [Candidatus Solibacter sp.]
MKRLFAIGVLGALLLAQNRMNYSLVSQESGRVALGLALRKLTVSGTFLQAPAHPDDETNALFALFGHGMGLRAIDLQNNRGDGGQNEIGPELFADMAVLRTSELLSAHRLDGAEQYFTRAIDYGYSFDPEEVIAKWGRKEIVGDYARLFRTLRPDVVVTMNIQGRGGDRAHEATTVLVHEGYLAAGDPNAYPEQLREGLRPWTPKKLYFAGGGGGGGRGGRGGRGGDAAQAPPIKLTPVNTAAYDPLLGRTYADIGQDARASHKCQGMGSNVGGFPGGGGPGGRGGNAPGARGGAQANAPGNAQQQPQGPPFGGRGGYQLMETTLAGQKAKDEAGLFDGIDTSLTSIAQYAGANPPQALTSALAAILAEGQRAQAAFAAGKDNDTAAPAEAGLAALRTLRGQLPSMNLTDAAKYEIDFRLKLKEHDYEDAVLAAHNLTFDALADDGLVVAGQAVRLALSASNRGATDVSVTRVEIAGFESPGACEPAAIKKDATFTCNAEARVPANAKPSTPYFHDHYWKHPSENAIQIFEPGVPFGAPFAPTLFRVTFHIKTSSVEVAKEVPVNYRYIKDVFTGDKRMELNVVPALSVRVTPGLVVIPAAKPEAREVSVAVTSGAKAAAQATVTLELPAGWKAEPASAPLTFAHEDESLSARFRVTPPAKPNPGEYTVRAVATSGANRFTNGYQEIEYPHIQRRQIMKPAEAALKVIDVKTAPGLSVGYVVGVGDQVSAAIEQLGAKVSYIDADELERGDLSKHDVIVTGVRAYEKRADLRAFNRRLIEFVERGGTLIVQYNKTGFNRTEFAPYPAQVSGNRVSDESVPVKVLTPSHPIFSFPNDLGQQAWANWVQERGLYFLGEKDPKYVDLVSMTDSFKDNPGEKLGALVEGRVGKGRWIYVGLGLWRQLPAGTDGAYQILANLLSLPKAP